MSALHHPLQAKIVEHMAAVEAAAKAGDVNAAVFSLLDVFAALGRDTAQRSWLVHHNAEDRDEKMQEAEDELAFVALKASWSRIYPELPGQIEGVLRECFQDEHFRCEDPLGWAEMNDEGLDGTGARQ